MPSNMRIQAKEARDMTAYNAFIEKVVVVINAKISYSLVHKETIQTKPNIRKAQFPCRAMKITHMRPPHVPNKRAPYELSSFGKGISDMSITLGRGWWCEAMV